jgi:hypothetical protein
LKKKGGLEGGLPLNFWPHRNALLSLAELGRSPSHFFQVSVGKLVKLSAFQNDISILI